MKRLTLKQKLERAQREVDALQCALFAVTMANRVCTKIIFNDDPQCRKDALNACDKALAKMFKIANEHVRGEAKP